MVSINCLPFKEKDAIIDSGENESRKIESGKSVEICKIASNNKIEEVRNKVVILENI